MPSPITDPLRYSSLLSSVIESTTDGIVVVDRLGEALHYNRRFLELWSLETVEGALHIDALLLSRIAEQLKDPLAFATQAQELYSDATADSKSLLELKDGRFFELYSRAQHRSQLYVGRIWTFRDVTAQQRAAIDLQRLPKSLEQQVAERTQAILDARIFVDLVLDNIPDIISVKDSSDLRYVRINRSFERFRGLDAKTVLGKTDFDFCSPEVARACLATDRAALAHGQPLELPEEQIVLPDGSLMILQTVKMPLLDGSGKPSYLLGIVSDITGQKRREADQLTLLAEQLAREQAEKALSQRDDFLSIASHELKTPLSSLALQIDILHRLAQRGALGSQFHDKALELLTLSQQQIQRFTALVDDLLDVSRISSGHLTLSSSKLDLGQVVRNVRQHLAQEIERSGSTVELQIEPAVIGQWDPLRLEQVVVNLLANAVKYGLGRPIRIEVSRCGDSAQLRVGDQGIGISAGDISRIFKRFERAASSRRFGGLGLGLYITREIVELHGGSIQVSSQLGLGSVFTVELPLHRPAPTSSPEVPRT